MKFFRLLLILLCLVVYSGPLLAAYEGEEPPPPYEGQEPPGPYEEDPLKQSGFFLGTDQGIMFFVGNAGNFINPQYYGTIYGGYNIKGLIQPMIRIGSAFGSLKGFFNPSTYFFIMEGGFRATPLRTKVRPVFLGTAGFYVLDFSNFGAAVANELNFTFAGGGGLEFSFGRSTIDLLGSYRGFKNSGLYLQGVEVTVGYTFQF